MSPAQTGQMPSNYKSLAEPSTENRPQMQLSGLCFVYYSSRVRWVGPLLSSGALWPSRTPRVQQQPPLLSDSFLCCSRLGHFDALSIGRCARKTHAATYWLSYLVHWKCRVFTTAAQMLSAILFWSGHFRQASARPPDKPARAPDWNRSACVVFTRQPQIACRLKGCAHLCSLLYTLHIYFTSVSVHVMLRRCARGTSSIAAGNAPAALFLSR